MDHSEAYRKKIDNLTDMLCRLMTAVDMDMEYSVTVPDDIEAWWKEHQIRDRERKAAVKSLEGAMAFMSIPHYRAK